MIVYECRSFLYRNFSCEDLVFVCAILYVCTVLDLRFYNFIFFCGSNHSIVHAFFGLSEIARLFGRCGFDAFCRSAHCARFLWFVRRVIE